MFLVIPLASAALGGAAAKAQQIIRRKRGGPKATSESLEEELINKTTELEKRSKELEKIRVELEKERLVSKGHVEVAAEQTRRVEQLTEQAKEHATKIEALEQEKSALQSQLDEMRSKVTEVISLLFHRKCSEAEASARLSLLGCEIEYVNDAEVFEMLEDKKDKKWEAGSSSFLLEDKQKLTLLMAGRQQLALTAGPSGDNSQWSRLPIVSFPKISQPQGSNARSLLPALKLPDLNKATKTIESSPQCDDISASFKDQDVKSRPETQKVMSLDDIAPAHDVAHLKAKGPTLKFTYSVQGSSSQPWIAKLPFSGESPAVNSPIKPMKDITFNKAELMSCADDFGVEGLALTQIRK